MKNIEQTELYELCELAAFAKEGHLGSSLSIMNILNSIYFLKEKQSIKFILSKGHASLALYSILRKYGYINSDQFLSFCKLDSSLGGHPDYRKVPWYFRFNWITGAWIAPSCWEGSGIKSKKIA